MSVQKFHGVFDHFIDKPKAGNTKFDTNLAVQVVFRLQKNLVKTPWAACRRF
jgi:hypothetical protein